MSDIEYRVNSGDTLFAIARRHNVAMDVLSRLNGLSDVNRIWAGQILRIPKQGQLPPSPPPQPGTYRVRAGDNLSKIAQNHKVSVDALIQANGLHDPDRIPIGLVLKVPKEKSQPSPQTQASSTQTFSTKAPSTKASSTKAPKRAPFLQGKKIESFGRVRNDEGVNFRDQPSTSGTAKKRLPFNTRLFVSREFPGDWYFVTLEDGSYGYVSKKYVSINPPDPWAKLHKIKPNEGALQLVKQYYKGDAISWGQDERYYVNVLVEANRGTGLRGIYNPSSSQDWSQTQTRQDYLIWIPSLGFAQSLRSKVRSGSISYEVWQSVKSAAVAIGDYYLGSAAFTAGLIHGALESIWDLLTGIVDLVDLIGKIIKSIFSGEFFSDLKSLWASVESLKVEELISAGLKSFLDRWNDKNNFLRKWHFRGWVIGYAISEIVMAVITGAVALVKWAGKAGKISKFIAKFPKVIKLSEKVTTASKSIPQTMKKRLQGVVSQTSDEVATAKKATKPVSSTSTTKAKQGGTHAADANSAGENGELSETHEALTHPRPEPKKGYVRFRGDYDEHVIKRDFDVKRSKGIGGAHNRAEFMKYAHEVNIVQVDAHPSLPGVSTIQYQMAALDKAQKPTGAWKAEIFQKTVYDPAVISDEQYLQWGRQAAAQAQAAGKLTREWEGVTPDGIKMRGYLDNTGAVRSFFFDF